MRAASSFSTGSQSFGERTSSFEWASVRYEFAWSPTRLKTAFKLALGSTLVMVLAFTFNWSSVATAMVVPLLFNRPDNRYDLRQMLWAAGATACISLFFYLSLNLSQNPLCFGLLLGGGLILHGAMTTLPTFGPCFAIAQVVGSSVLVLYFYEPNPTAGVFFALTVSTALGYAVVLAVNYLIWPYSPREVWDERLRSAWCECRRAYARWFAAPGRNGRPLERPNSLDRQTVQLLGLLSRITPTDGADKGPELRTLAATRVQEIIILLQDLRRLGNDLTASSPEAFTALGAALDDQFAFLGGILAGTSNDASSGKRSLTEAVQAASDTLRAGSAARMIEEDLRQLCATLDVCVDLFRALAKLPLTERLTDRTQSVVWTPPFRWKTVLQLNAASFHHGIKVALVVLSCMGFWQAFRWPSGNSLIISGLTVTLPAAGLSSRQSILRVWGLLLGLFCSYVCIALVVTYVETIFGYGLCVFCVLLALGYLSGSSPRVAYIGFQAALTFVFVFVSSSGEQSIDLEPLRARFVALVAGVVIATVIMNNLWSVRKVNSLFTSLAGNFATCARAWNAFVRGGEELAAKRKELISQFNKGFMEAAQLTTVVEYEGGEGTPRYGYAGRLLTHQIALFEQLHLFGSERAVAAASSNVALPQAERIRERFLALARRIGHPLEFFPGPPEAKSDSLPVESADGLASHQNMPEGRSAEIEGILASIDRLTSLAETT
jgi:uncharacterized membrane protein YccC